MHFERFDPKHVVAAVRLTRHLKSVARFEANLQDAAEMLSPAENLYQQAIVDRRLTLPSTWTIRRARVMFDVAAMLVRRCMHREERRKVVRYVGMDASPKKGTEIFNIVEKTTCDGKFTDSGWRKLPLMLLEQGAAASIDKCVRVVHAAFLEAGPNRADMRRWFDEVVWVIVDGGAERLTVDQCDLIGVYMDFLDGGTMPADWSVIDPESYLFRHAMRGPGWNHNWDLVEKDVCSQIVWFPI